jgi:hypothetical protein
MRIVKDTTVFTDASGDTLTLLDCPRQRDVEKSDEMERQEAMANLKDLGMTMAEAIKEAQSATAEETSAATAALEGAPKSAKVRRFRLEVLAKAMCLGGQNYGGQAILEAYDEFDPESAAWADAQVSTVWAHGTLSDAEREG